MLKQDFTFRARLTLAFGALFLAMTFAASLIVERVVAGNILRNNGQRLANISYGVAKVVASNLEEREREIKLLAMSSHLKPKQIDLKEFSHEINNLKQSYPYYAWIGYANLSGVVESAAGDLLVGKDVSSRPWYAQGKLSPFIGDLHEAVLLAKLLGIEDTSNPLRFIDFAAPVFGSDEKLKGVVATHVRWDWMQHIIDGFLAEPLKSDGILVFVVDKSNKVISPLEAIGTVEVPNPPNTPSIYYRAIWKDGVEYQYASTTIQASTGTHLDWRVVVRQPANFVGTAITDLKSAIFQVSLVSILILLVLSYWIARQISLPLERISRQADKVSSSGELIEWKANTTVPELVSLAHSVQEMTKRLFDAQASLEKNNSVLELAVSERTAALQQANQELEAKAAELNVLARIDQLTGAPNRRAANEELLKLWNLFRRKTIAYCVILIDIDFFKRINDTYGHDVGDLTLQTLARILLANSRQVDTVCRFGGEEFLVCLPGTDIIGAQYLAEKLRVSIENHSFPHIGSLTISAGVANCDIHDQNELDIVSRADVALYEAKNSGRNQVRIGAMSLSNESGGIKRG